MNAHGINREQSIHGWYIQLAICAIKSFNAVMNAVIFFVPNSDLKKLDIWIAEFSFLYLITVGPVLLFGCPLWFFYIGTPLLFALNIFRHIVNKRYFFPNMLVDSFRITFKP